VTYTGESYRTDRTARVQWHVCAALYLIDTFADKVARRMQGRAGGSSRFRPQDDARSRGVANGHRGWQSDGANRTCRGRQH
jgi:hypothetical protein